MAVMYFAPSILSHRDIPFKDINPFKPRDFYVNLGVAFCSQIRRTAGKPVVI